MQTLPNWKRIKHDAALRARLGTRGRVIRAVRRFFESQDFTEVETPVVVGHAGMEPNLNPLETVVTDEQGRQHRVFLITSPEYSLKKLLAGGMERVFEITRAFRNGEPWSEDCSGGEEAVQHNPEFSILEWYRAGCDYTALMADVERMVMAAASAAAEDGEAVAFYQGTAIDFRAPWPRMSVREAFEEYADGMDLEKGIDDPELFARQAADRGIEVLAEDGFDEVFFKVFLRDIEPKLGVPAGPGHSARPVILYDYPRSMAALARFKGDDQRFAERFEVYCLGIELANAFSELTDAAEQEARLKAEQAERAALGKPEIPIDGQFIEAVGMMPEAAGIAFGLDRLVMLLTDSRDIRDVIYFPAADLFGAGTEKN